MKKMAEQFLGFIAAETPKAILFQDHFWHEPDWMPKSQITMVRQEETHEVVIVATPWICGQKNIREFEERKDA